MTISVDPVVFIADWLEEKWVEGNPGFTPTFSTDPYDDDMVLPMITTSEGPIDVDHMNVKSTYHMFYNRYTINLRETDKAKLWAMRVEVRRIVLAYQKYPTTATYPSPGIRSILIYSEAPFDDPTKRPILLHRALYVIVEHLEINA